MTGKLLDQDISGFTLIEVVFIIAIIGTLSAIVIPTYANYLEKTRITKAIAEIHIMEKEIMSFQEDNNGVLPNNLNNIGRIGLMDPWGRPYQYLNISTAPPGQARKDKFLVPLNSGYDLYSMGKDGKSKPPLTANASHDDIIRANDGRYVGLASEY